MKSFLGSANFFSPFVPLLHDTTKKGFDWNKDTWNQDYEDIFEAFKKLLIEAVQLYYPDYNNEFVVRCDACPFGVGGVLLMRLPDDTLVPIQFISAKFSEVAQRWTIIEQEAYALYYTVYKLQYYLLCKAFILKTDHANLLWMEQSKVPKIMRWLMFLQMFTFTLMHIAGKHNLVADYFSRIPILNLLMGLTQDDLFSRVHGGRRGHPGARITWTRLRDEYPGHGLTFKQIVEYIHACPTCQKARLGYANNIPDVVRHLIPPVGRNVVGIDTLSLIPDANGYNYLIVIVVMATKLVRLMPSRDKSATSTAMALFFYCTAFGVP
jgi:hypothetical protein